MGREREDRIYSPPFLSTNSVRIKLEILNLEQHMIINVLAKTTTAQKLKFPINDLFSKSVSQKTVDLVAFTEEIFNGKLHYRPMYKS